MFCVWKWWLCMAWKIQYTCKFASHQSRASWSVCICQINRLIGSPTFIYFKLMVCALSQVHVWSSCVMGFLSHPHGSHLAPHLYLTFQTAFALFRAEERCYDCHRSDIEIYVCSWEHLKTAASPLKCFSISLGFSPILFILLNFDLNLD